MRDQNHNSSCGILPVFLAAGLIWCGGTAVGVRPASAADQSDCGDVNQSGTVSSADIIYLVNFVFKSGPMPDCPGLDPAMTTELLLHGVTDGIADGSAQAALSELANQVVVNMAIGNGPGALAGLITLGDSAIAYYQLDVMREFETDEVVHTVAGIAPGLITPAATVTSDNFLSWYAGVRACVKQYLLCEAMGGTQCMQDMAMCLNALCGNPKPYDASWDDLGDITYNLCLTDDVNPGNPSWCAFQAAWYLMGLILE